MKRLTYRNNDGEICVTNRYDDENDYYITDLHGSNTEEFDILNNIADKLAAYEDAEEQGRLVIFPATIIELKPCPFCGEIKALEYSNMVQLEDCPHLEECKNVDHGECPYVCVTCSLNKGGCGTSSKYDANKKDVREAWNRRV